MDPIGGTDVVSNPIWNVCPSVTEVGHDTFDNVGMLGGILGSVAKTGCTFNVNIASTITIVLNAAISLPLVVFILSTPNFMIIYPGVFVGTGGAVGAGGIVGTGTAVAVGATVGTGPGVGAGGGVAFGGVYVEPPLYVEVGAGTDVGFGVGTTGIVVGCTVAVAMIVGVGVIVGIGVGVGVAVGDAAKPTRNETIMIIASTHHWIVIGFILTSISD